jgi:hypothetical protein
MTSLKMSYLNDIIYINCCCLHDNIIIISLLYLRSYRMSGTAVDSFDVKHNKFEMFLTLYTSTLQVSNHAMRKK